MRKITKKQDTDEALRQRKKLVKAHFFQLGHLDPVVQMLLTGNSTRAAEPGQEETSIPRTVIRIIGWIAILALAWAGLVVYAVWGG